MPVQETKGSASAQGYGFGLGAPATYIEDVFSTWLYTGNGSTQTITNGIDLAGKGGLVWIKNRTAAFGNRIYSNGLTASGYRMYTNTTAAQGNSGNALTYASNGWSIVSANNDSNDTIYNYVSWTFREQPKFFDIVTYTGNGVSGRQIAHNLGSAPGAIIVKGTSTANAWTVYHRSLNNASGGSLYLNSTSAQDLDPTNWNSTNPTSSVFTLGSGATNTAGVTYVAYLFAHDAGGFGLSGNENVISCGSYVGSNTTDVPLNLGYEPQFMLIKNITTGTTDWYIADIMRGMAYTGIQPLLAPNLSDAETAYSGAFFKLRANGVDVKYGSGTAICSAGNTYIYIAIRRGPMKTPTIGTSVFSPTIYSGNNTNKSITGVGFATDLIINKPRANTLGAGNTGVFWDRLRGFPDGSTNPGLVASSTADEATWASLFNMFGYINNTNSNPQDGYQVLNGSTDGRYVNYSSEATGYISWSLKRAPGFFDIVCYTGTGVSRTVAHNLTVVPELMIVKSRDLASRDWMVYCAGLTANNFIKLNLANAQSSSNYAFIFGNGTVGVAPTSSVFTVGSGGDVNAIGYNYVAYLFATVAGVSKVGSYTGTGATLNINAGFTTGARFVMIKRTDSTGSWFIWDTARGMVSGTDPKVAANDAAAESNANWVYTATSGFQIVTTDATVNASGGSYIYLAIA